MYSTFFLTNLMSLDNDGLFEGISPEGSIENFHVTLDMILMFATGCHSEPPVGFTTRPSLRFQSGSPYPSANTCTNTINLPLADTNSSFEQFVYFMSYGVLNSAGFGCV